MRYSTALWLFFILLSTIAKAEADTGIIKLKNFEKLDIEFTGPLTYERYIITKDQKLQIPDLIIGQPIKLKTIQLTEDQYGKFLGTLEKCSFLKLSEKRCPSKAFDAGIFEFKFISNAQVIIRQNPCFDKIQWQFYKYLRDNFGKL